MHIADSRIPFARIDPRAHIGVSFTEHNDLRRLMRPVDTKHQWVEECLIQRVGHVPVVLIVCVYAGKGCRKQHVQTDVGQGHAFRERDDPFSKGPFEVFFARTIPTKDITQGVLDDSFLRGLPIFDLSNAIQTFTPFVDQWFQDVAGSTFLRPCQKST